MKDALLFLERNMGSGYEHAFPPLNPLRFWWFRTRVLPRSDAVLKEAGHLANLGRESSPSFELPSEGTASTFSGRGFTVYSLLVQPDTLCTDKKARNPKFTLHAVFPSNLNFISGPFQALLAKCRSIGWNTLRSGCVESLRVPIPDSLFLPKHR